MSSFDERAATWDDDPAKVQRANEVATAIAAAVPLDPAMRMLEYGAGTGLVSQALRDLVGPLALADTSVGMLDVIRAKVAAGVLPDARVWDLDLSTQPPPPPHGRDQCAPCVSGAPKAGGSVADERFDLIVTVLTLHHIDDTAAVLRAFAALLDDGGHLCIADLDHEDGSFHGEHFHGHHGFDRAALAGDLTAAGFTDIRFDDCGTIKRGGVEFSMFLATARRATVD